jgi:hypothetical protein
VCGDKHKRSIEDLKTMKREVEKSKRQFEGLAFLCTDPVTLETVWCATGQPIGKSEDAKREVEKRQFEGLALLCTDPETLETVWCASGQSVE